MNADPITLTGHFDPEISSSQPGRYLSRYYSLPIVSRFFSNRIRVSGIEFRMLLLKRNGELFI